MNLWKKARKLLATACCLAVALSLIPAAGAAEGSPVQSNNKNDEDYTLWSRPVNSYLYKNEAGGLTRVEYLNGQVVIEDYNSTFQYQSGRTIAAELPLWGGFFAGEEYNFLIFGQENRGESSSAEVIRVVKYDKNWNRLGQASLTGANTTVPFDAGSLRCDEYNGYLYIRTCHEMFKLPDGYNHQANLMLAIREQDMTITDSFYDIWNKSYGYISHSFNQFILVDEDGKIVTLDHGDAVTRGVVFMRYSANAGQGKFSGQQYGTWCSDSLLQAFAGADGDNTTGASVGGLAETRDSYVAAYNYDQKGGNGDRYVYFHWINKASGKDGQIQVTQTPGATTPVLVSTGLDGGYLMWNGKSGYQVNDTLYYLTYGADGQPGAVQTATGVLSDCQPIYYNDKVTWYTTNSSIPTFYQLDASGVKATVANTAPVAPPEQPVTPVTSVKTAVPTNDQLYVDGQLAVPAAYKIGGSNYFKIRDVAALLDGTDAQFSVGYDNAAQAVTLTTGEGYEKKSSDLAGVPAGDKEAVSSNDAIYINGEKAELTVYKIGGSNYFKLRDLGAALGFNVGYTAGYGAFIETDKP